MEEIEIYLAEIQVAIGGISRERVAAAVLEIESAWLQGRTVFTIGNGGSAATASHMAADFSRATRVDGMPRLRVVALTDSIPLLTALANDVDYSSVFQDPLESLAAPGDVLVAISASGNSPNIVSAVEFAKDNGIRVIGLCGDPGGRLAVLADIAVTIPAQRIGQQEDGHLILNHAIAGALFARNVRRAAQRT